LFFPISGFYITDVASSRRNDIEISNVLPELSQEQVKAVVERLKSLGVNERKDLEQVTEENLSLDGLLSKMQVVELLKRWKENHGNTGLFFSLRVYVVVEMSAL